jgi:HSP20 family protein
MRGTAERETPGRAWRRAGEAGPPVDLYETAEAVIIRVGVPGAEGASLALTIEEDVCVLRGETPAPGARWGDRTIVHWQEIPYGRFERRVPLPTVVRQEATKASFRNGVLEIVLPKKIPQGQRTVQIPVT